MKNLISIVIINKNDRALATTLEACSTLPDKLDYELIVVDSSEGKLDDIARQFPSVKWIPFTPRKDKPITIPEARNTGVRAAKGNIIVFIDANCLPQKNWLTKLTQPILKQHESIVAGATRSQNKSTTHDLPMKENRTKQYITECPTINLAFTRELCDAIGGFDECFDYGSDVDFSWRVIDAGVRVRYEPAAIISHDWGDRKQEMHRSFLYGKARTRLYRKHKKIGRLLTHDMILVIYPIYIVGLIPLTIIWPWYPLLLVIPALKNYNKKPLATLIDHFAYSFGALDEIFVQPFRRPIHFMSMTHSIKQEEV
jgi:GT2 family glycosyltransferase